MEYAAHEARERGAAVYLLSGAEREVHDPFGSLRHWLRELCAHVPVESEAGLETRLRALISHDETAGDYLPDLIQLLDASADLAPAGLDPETRRRLQVQGVCAFIGALARKQPLFLALDDLQWMDPLTLEAVRTLADRVLAGELCGCFLLVAYRAGTPPAWLAADAETYEPYVWPVRALDESACLELMRQWVRPEDLPEAVVDGIIGRAGGHPHYLVELLRHLLETEALRLEDGRWQWTPVNGQAALPDTLYGAVAARLDRLQTGQLAAVQHGATVGQQFPVWLVRELEPTLAWEENLAALEGMQFLTEQSPPPDREMRFKQAVVRDVAYESLLVGHRRVLHGRIAALLEERVPLRDCAALLAWHYEYAEMWEPAARCHHEAGRIAAELFSNEEALRHQEAALTTLARAGVACSEREFEARRALASVAARLGQYARAASEYERCLQWAEAALEAQADVCGQLARCRHEIGALKTAGALWRRALRCLTGEQTPQAGRIRAALLGEWGFAEYRAGNFGRALRLGAWSHRAALAAGAILEQADAANLRGLVQQARGEMDSAIAAYRETQELAERTGDIAALATVRNNLGTLLFARGQLDEAQAAYEAALATWDRVGDRGQSATVLTNLGNLALARGQYDAAAAEFQRAHQLFSNSNQPFGAAAAAAVLGEVFLEQNNLDGAVESLTEALETAKSLDAPDLAAYAGIGLAEAGFRLGHEAAAANFLDAADSLIEQYDLVPLRGQAWRMRGKLAVAAGDADEAQEFLNRALAHFEEIEMRQEAGRTLVVLASLPGRADRDELLARAREIFLDVGAEGDLARLETNPASGQS